MSDFTWTPSIGGADVSYQPRIKSIQFGDGYEQRAGDGINNNLQVWALSFNNRTTTVADAIIAFLNGKGGVTKFTFTPPEHSEITVICKSWRRKQVEPGIATVTCQFKEVAEA